MSECDPCKPVDCANADDYELYNLQSNSSRDPVLASNTEPCKTCLPIDCGSGSRLDDDYNLYRLQSELYRLVIPFGLNVPGAEMRLDCCGVDIIRIVPQGLSEGQFNFLVGQMIDECSLSNPFCDSLGPPTRPPVLTLRIVCCDGSAVVRQIVPTTPIAEVQSILNQMQVECALRPGCQNPFLIIQIIDDRLAIIITDLENVLTLKRALVGLLISGTNQQLLDAAAAEDLLVNTLLNHVNELITTITTIINDGGLTPPQLVIVNVILTISNELSVLAVFMTAIDNLVRLIALGGNVSAAEGLLAAQQNAMTATANAKLDVVTDLPTIGSTPIIVLLGALLTKLAADTNGLSQLAALQVTARELSTAFILGDTTELISAANHATAGSITLGAAVTSMVSASNSAQVALNAAIADGSVTPALAARMQADITVELALAGVMQCQADAAFGLATVAVATATGLGMFEALLDLFPIAACLDASEIVLTATGNAQAIELVPIVHDLGVALRALALGTGTASAASMALNRKARIEMIVLLVVQLDLEIITTQVVELVLTTIFGTVVLNFTCFPGLNTLSRNLPLNFTAQQLAAAYASMAAECEVIPIPDRFFPDGDDPTPVQLYASEPQSCTVFCDDLTPFNWTTTRGLYIGFSQAAVNTSAHRAACEQANFYRLCLSNLPATCCFGVASSVNVVASGGSSGAGNVWSITSGALPTGMTLVPHGTFATISGTPSAAGSFTFRIRVVASNGAFNSRTYTIRCLQILPLTLHPFQVGTPYSQQLTLSAGGGGETYAVASGALPAGITLTSTGMLSGIPTAALAYSFTISATEV